MSILIDDLIEQHKNGPYCDAGKIQKYTDYYLAKPYPFYSIFEYLKRFKDAWNIIIDKSRAYHYKEDERSVNE